MATKNTPPSDAAVQTTPESIPVPGGGRYRWSDTAPHWVEINEDGNPVNPVTPVAPTTDQTLGA